MFGIREWGCSTLGNRMMCHIAIGYISYTYIIIYIYTLWLFNIAMENGPFIDDLPI